MSTLRCLVRDCFQYGNAGPIYLYESSGVFRQYQITTNISGAHCEPAFRCSGYYLAMDTPTPIQTVRAASSANSYDFSSEYGRASFDIRHRFQMGGNGQLRFRSWRLNPNIEISSAPPFNITAGRDLNGDSLFTDRPAFATVAPNPAIGVFATPWGVFQL